MGKIFFERKASLHFPLSAARSTRFGTVPLCLEMVVTTDPLRILGALCGGG